VFAHRGASAEAPENTLAAFCLAAEQGADGLELDVWRCGSGEVVVHHDADTLRTAGTRMRLDRASLGELRALDVGAWKGQAFRGERIPLLAEVLEAVPSLVVNVELKAARFPDLGLPSAVVEVIREARAEERCLLSSFDLVLLKTLRVVAPELRSAVLLGKDASAQLFDSFCRVALRPTAVHPHHSLATAERVRAWRARSLDVNVWTVDAAEEMRRVAEVGVTGIVTNRPALALETLGRRR
jgi:glycerophosphoryl diester phosphodiesterase